MGGIGSGSYHRSGQKRTVDQLRYVTVRDYLAGWVPSGWLLGTAFQVAWTPCHFGGERPWLCCPECGRRAYGLYGRHRRWACRQCWNLAYPSQRLRPDRRRLQRLWRLRERLGLPATLLVPIQFARKPDRMHWRTYDRLYREAEALEAQVHADGEALAAVLLERLRRRADRSRKR